MIIDDLSPDSRHRCEAEERGWVKSRCIVVEASCSQPPLMRGLVLLKRGWTIPVLEGEELFTLN